MNLRQSNEQLRAILVCVDYADLLAITLPRNRHHFKEVWVVTHPQDDDTRKLAHRHDCQLHTTEVFYERGADFNKWAALEQGLDAMGRQGWLCIMDADVVWPVELPDYQLKEGRLYTPLRYMAPLPGLSQAPPPEMEWSRYNIHKNVGEWAGYSQIFHHTDPHLPACPPWHEVDWKHAGGADSYFQARWPINMKIRPPFHVLHLGEAGTNWCGRASAYRNGHVNVKSRERMAKVVEYCRQRRGKTGVSRHSHERLDPPEPPVPGRPPSRQ